MKPIHQNKIIITGDIGVGKSTLLRNVLAEITVPFDGFKTTAIVKNHILVGFEFGRINRPEKYRFAKLVNPNLPGPEKYEIDSTVFNEKGVELLQQVQANFNLIVLDELGIMEFNSISFLKEIAALFRTRKPVIAVIQQRALAKYLEPFDTPNYRIMTVTRSNRDVLRASLQFEIITMLKNSHLC